MSERADGLTEQEGVAMDHLIAAFEAFGSLPPEHPDEMRDFARGIHECQFWLGLRVCRRTFPEGWPRHAVPGTAATKGLT